MTMGRRQIAIACGCLFAAANPLASQAIEVEVHLAADPERSGPPGWTWLREAALPRVVGNWGDRDSLAALSFHVDAHGKIELIEAGATEAYLEATVRIDSADWLAATCDVLGCETWRCAGGIELPPRLMSLAHLLGVQRPEAHVFDTPALVAHLAPAMAHDDGPWADLLTIGAVECGDTRFVIDWSSSESIAHGYGGGGLLLPAALAVIAELQNDDRGLDHARPFDEREHWRIQAFTARSGARFEAAAQLGRLGEAESIDVLERLLWTEDATRSSAMAGLIRAGSSASLSRIVHAADKKLRGTHGLAAVAVFNLWDDADESTREAIASAVLAPEPRTPAPESVAPTAPDGTSNHATILALLFACFVVTLVRYVKLESRLRAQRS